MSETIRTYDDTRAYVQDKVEVMPQFLNTSFSLFAGLIDEHKDEFNKQISETQVSDEALVSFFILHIIFPKVVWGSYSLFNVSEMDILQEKGIFTPEQLQAARQWVQERQDET